MPPMQASIVESHGLAHMKLLKDLAALEAAVSSSAEGAASLATRLEATRTNLREHFRSEEQNGYMDLVRRREPRLERAVGHLAEEHRALALTLDALVEEAQARPTLDEPFREQVREWIDEVRRHEVREIDLIQEAFNFDVSGED